MSSEFKGPILHREVSGSDARRWFNQMPSLNDPDYVRYFNDFTNSADYAAADWTITTVEAGAGSATEALAANERGGALVLTNDDADNDSDSLQLNEESFSLTSGKQLWFEARVKVADADTEDALIGLCITDTTPLAATDHVGFRIVTTDASIQCECNKDSATTQKDSEQDMADDTYVKLGFHYNGSDMVRFYVDRVMVAEISTNIPDDENLAVTIHHQNGDAAADAMSIDYINVVMER